MRQLAIWPHEPLQLEYGFNQFIFENIPDFFQLTQFFQGVEANVTISEAGKPKTLKEVCYIGDVTTLVDFRKLYDKQIQVAVQNMIDDLSLQQLMTADLAIKMVVDDVIMANNLPVQYSDKFDLTAILKYCEFHAEMPETKGICGIIEHVIDLANRLSDDRLIVFSNLNLYLSTEEIQMLAFEASVKQVSCLLIDVTKSPTLIESEGLKQYYFDRDFIEFTSDDVR